MDHYDSDALPISTAWHPEYGDNVAASGVLNPVNDPNT
jgi:hypothetical protein